MGFNINLGGWNSVFVVPSCVVDKHIKLAGSVQLKVLLWILRHAGEELTQESIAQALSMHPADVKDALQYWIETGLITVKDNKLIPGEPKGEDSVPQKEDVAEPDTKPVADSKEKPIRLMSRPQKPDSIFVANRIKSSPDIATMIQEAELSLGRILSQPDVATLIMMHDNDGLPVDVIIMLIQYAVSLGKTNMKYIEKMAIEWGAEEIDTLQKAENKIISLSQRRDAWNIVLKATGIEHRSATAKEEKLANQWVNEMGFGIEMIKEAYERCVNAKGKYIAGYIDKILTRWHDSGLKTLEQVKNEGKAGNTKKYSNATGRYAPTYNLEEYEKYSIFDE